MAGGRAPSVKLGLVVPTFEIAGNCETKNNPRTTRTVIKSVDCERRIGITSGRGSTQAYRTTESALIE